MELLSGHGTVDMGSVLGWCFDELVVGPAQPTVPFRPSLIVRQLCLWLWHSTRPSPEDV
jgi:hypothetical protein